MDTKIYTREEIRMYDKALDLIDDNLGVNEDFIITNRFATASLIMELIKKEREPYYRFLIDFMKKFDENGLGAPEDIMVKRAYSALENCIVNSNLSEEDDFNG